MNTVYASNWLQQKVNQFPLYAMYYLFEEAEVLLKKAPTPCKLHRFVTNETKHLEAIEPMLDALKAGKTITFTVDPIYKELYEGYIGVITQMGNDEFQIERTMIYYFEYPYTDNKGVYHEAIELERETTRLVHTLFGVYKTLRIALEYSAKFEVQ